jgi:hypothetical protein
MARKVFCKKATLNIGDGSDGQFAVVTRCMQQIDFSLWATREGAEKWKARFDRVGAAVAANWGGAITSLILGRPNSPERAVNVAAHRFV